MAFSSGDGLCVPLNDTVTRRCPNGQQQQLTLYKSHQAFSQQADFAPIIVVRTL
jgi:hypothetical protein